MKNGIKREIKVERTLVIGGAKLSEGDYRVYVKFYDGTEKPYGRWMYAMLIQLTDTKACFMTAKRECIWLMPGEIIEITDGRLDMTDEEIIRLHQGEIIKCEIEEETVKNQQEDMIKKALNGDMEALNWCYAQAEK